MSILFESLSQKEPGEQSSVPDIHASHFDDEMLGDEWLLRRLKWWRLISFILLILLLSSWLYFAFKSVEEVRATENIQTTENNSPASSPVKPVEQATTAAIIEEVEKPIQNKSTNQNPVEQAKAEETVEKKSITKRVYKPQKNSAQTEVSAISKKPPPQTTITAKPSRASNAAAVFVHELSQQQRSQFPNIEISSLVVADSEKDSFIILDGKFYKVDQVISADLILRKISNQTIEVEFQSQLVKVPVN